MQTRAYGVQEAASPGGIWNTSHLYLDSILPQVCELFKYKEVPLFPFLYSKLIKKKKIKICSNVTEEKK